MADQFLQRQNRSSGSRQKQNAADAKRRKLGQGRDALEQLVVDTAKLAIDNRKQIRKHDAGLTHTGLAEDPIPKCLLPVAEVSDQYRGADQVEGAAKTWEKLTDVLSEIECEIEIARQAIDCLKKYVKERANTAEHVIRCVVKHTHSKKQLRVSYWVRGIDNIQVAVQVALVQLGFIMQHGPAPPLLLERNCVSSLAAVLGNTR
eukprot:TRINITY_DN93303_c0_g1_i1.p1 TRINITY_DN93303_c0_g1~~TRINITY_DN93303_c0_g1_i1.p1  ORF type:complete len:204 (+),score=30.34 TRINITY_DN93303_c0_g1_i1:186-797(+)